MEFNIGDRVRVCGYNEIPGSLKNKGIARICGKDGEVVDKMWSVAKDCTVYKVLLDGKTETSSVDFTDEMLIPYPPLENKTYQYEFEYLDNVVVAVLYEDCDLGKREIARGHGHIIHEGVEGIAQAASYALKRIYYSISNNNI
jgi:hypothetical protein